MGVFFAVHVTMQDEKQRRKTTLPVSSLEDAHKLANALNATGTREAHVCISIVARDHSMLVPIDHAEMVWDQLATAIDEIKKAKLRIVS